MKTLISSLLLFLTSCVYVVEPVPTPATPQYTYGMYYYTPPQRDCTCGYVREKGVDQWGNYYIEVQNQCSGNMKRFTFEKDEWVKYQVADGICLTRNSSW